MNVKATARYNKAGTLREVSVDEYTFCCTQMQDAVDAKFIGFGDYDYFMNTDTDVNIYKCTPYPDGAVWDCMAINLCPFCGAQITVDFLTMEMD